jgi:uncharacterized delta-60 repeat protein
MKKFGYLFFTALLGMGIETFSQDASGNLDVTFNGTGMVIQNNGFLDLYQDAKMTPDGKIVAVGTSYDATYASDIQVSRYLDNGSPDPAFGTDGVFRFHLGYETGGYACHVKDDGTILVAGISMDNFGGFEMVLLRLTDKGVLDEAFGDNGVARYDYGEGEDIAYAMAVQQDGKILLAGHIRNAEFRFVPAIVRFTEEGILDATFGDNGLAVIPVTESDNEFAGIQVQPDGKIVAAGHISNGLSWFSLLLARFDESGTLDPSFGDNGIVNMNIGNVDDEFFDLRLTSGGEIVATGFTTSQDDLNFHLLVMKFDGSGVPVPGFGQDGMIILGETSYNVGYALEILPDDKIVVAGSSGEKAPGNSDWGIWKFNADGSPDLSFGTGGLVTTDGGSGQFDEALGIAVQADGKLVTAGKFRINDNIDFAVCRYLNDLTVSVPELPVQNQVQVLPNPAGKNGMVNIVMQVPETQAIRIELFNVAGKVVMQRSLGMQPAGLVISPLSLSPGIPSGPYILRISGSKSLSATHRFLVVE